MYVNRTYMYENHTMLSVAEVKILEVFLDTNRHYFGELVKVTKLTRPRTLRVLRKLVKQDVLEVKAEANVKYYSLRKLSSVYSLLSLVEYNRALLFLEKHKTLKRALEMLREKYGEHLVMLVFGSMVKGYAVKTSDVDVLILKDAFSSDEIKRVEDIVGLINGRTGLKISSYLMKMKEFKQGNELAKEIIKKHIIIDGGELFFRMVLK